MSRENLFLSWVVLVTLFPSIWLNSLDPSTTTSKTWLFSLSSDSSTSRSDYSIMESILWVIIVLRKEKKRFDATEKSSSCHAIWLFHVLLKFAFACLSFCLLSRVSLEPSNIMSSEFVTRNKGRQMDDEERHQCLVQKEIISYFNALSLSHIYLTLHFHELTVIALLMSFLH